jgi:hypothetical protein
MCNTSEMESGRLLENRTANMAKRWCGAVIAVTVAVEAALESKTVILIFQGSGVGFEIIQLELNGR